MPSSTSKQDDINRRDFLRRTALGAAGIALTSALPPFPRGNICADGQVSRIVIVTDEAASSGTTIVPDVVQVMMDRGVMELTGEPSVSQAWQSLLPGLVPTSRIGIKVNCINRYLSSHPQVVQAIVDELATIEIGQTALPRNNIVVWDRHNYELTRAGYSVYSGYDPHLHRCFGTDQAGYGYDDASSIQVHGQTCHPSIILTQHCDYLINLSVLKNHTMAGTTGSLKNHFGSIHNPEELHGAPSQYCDPFIPALNRKILDELGVAQTVSICDAIFGISDGGPSGYPQFAYNGLLLSTDPVALDYQAIQILASYGCGTITMATHIDTAASPPYELGTNNPQQMDLRYISNPSTGCGQAGEVASRPADYRLELAYPNPFNSLVTIPYYIGGQTSVSVRLDVFNARGQRICTLYQGRREPGRHLVVWDGRDGKGGALGSGIYFCRLSAAGYEKSIKLSLLR